MKPLRVVVALVVTGLALGGCGALTGERFNKLSIRHFDRDGADVLTEPIQGQAVIFLPGATNERYCRTPSADFAATVSEGATFSFFGRAVGEDAARGALALGGRNPDVLITRELMYRACELIANIRATPEQATEIYKRFLETVEKVAKAQTGTGTAAAAALPIPVVPKLPPPPPARTTPPSGPGTGIPGGQLSPTTPSPITPPGTTPGAPTDPLTGTYGSQPPGTPSAGAAPYAPPAPAPAVPAPPAPNAPFDSTAPPIPPSPMPDPSTADQPPPPTAPSR